jgi:hypothetical protein
VSSRRGCSTQVHDAKTSLRISGSSLIGVNAYGKGYRLGLLREVAVNRDRASDEGPTSRPIRYRRFSQTWGWHPQYVREPLTAGKADRRANARETPTEQLVVLTLLDAGLRVSEPCKLTAKDVLRQQRQLPVRGKARAGPTARSPGSASCPFPAACELNAPHPRQGRVGPQRGLAGIPTDDHGNENPIEPFSAR